MDIAEIEREVERAGNVANSWDFAPWAREMARAFIALHELSKPLDDQLKSRVIVTLKAYADHLSDEAEAHDKHGDDELGVEADTASDDVWALIRELEGDDEST